MNIKTLGLISIILLTSVTNVHSSDLEDQIFAITTNVILDYESFLSKLSWEKSYNDRLHSKFKEILEYKYKNGFTVKNEINKKIEVFKLYDENQNYLGEDAPSARLWVYRKITCLIMLSMLSDYQGLDTYLSEAERMIKRDDEFCEEGEYYLLILLLEIYFQAIECDFKYLNNGMKGVYQNLYDYGKHIEKHKYDRMKELYNKVTNIFKLIEEKCNDKFKPGDW